MPLIELDTSCDLAKPGKKEALAKTLSQLASEGTGKPEQYVMTCVRDKAAMTMSGEAGPCAVVTVKAIGGLNKQMNQALAETVTQMLQEELAIPPDRVYIVFEELAATHWAWDGRTFG